MPGSGDPQPVDPRLGSRGVLLTTLLLTMTIASFQLFAFAVLAVDIIDDLGINRTAIGALGSLNTFVGAVTAPLTGRLTDRIGARRAIIWALLISGVGMAMMALSTTWVLLAVSAVVSGVPQGWANPSTNALIAERVPSPDQGTVTGIKQSGVQFGIFLSGLTLPTLALAVGWRGSAWVYAAAFTATAVAVMAFLGEHDPAVDAASPGAVPSDAHGSAGATDGSAGAAEHPIPGFIWRLTLYAFCFGTAGGAIGRFFPLWANEVVGLSVSRAGLLVAFGGLLGIAARIAAGRLARTWMAPSPMLAWLAVIGALYCASLLVTTSVGSWILWPTTVFNAVGIGAWNAVAMLAVIIMVPKAAAGRASGRVMVGFLGGLAIGSPVAGWVVDRWGTYQPVWWAALVLSLISAALVWPRSSVDRAEAASVD